MINSKTKLIFILVPGIREYIKQHGAHDDTCRVISRAIKVSDFFLFVHFPRRLIVIPSYTNNDNVTINCKPFNKMSEGQLIS